MDFMYGHSLLTLALPQCVSHCANWSGERIFSSPLLNIAWNSEVEVALRQACFKISIFAFWSSVRFSLLNISPQDASFALLLDMPPQQPESANTDAALSEMTAATVNAKNFFINALLLCWFVGLDNILPWIVRSVTLFLRENRVQNALGRKWCFHHPYAAGVVNGICQRGKRAVDPDLGDTLRAEGASGFARLAEDRADLWRVHRREQPVVEEARVEHATAFVEYHLFAERVAQAVQRRAFHLALSELRVNRHAAIHGADVIDHAHLARLHVQILISRPH